VVTAKPATDLELVGGNPALDLANTLDGPRDGAPGADSLRDYAELAAWGAYAGVLDAAPAARLAAAARDRPREAAAVLARARALRTAVYAVFRAVAAGEDPPAGALAALSAEHAAALPHARLAPVDGGFDHAWEDGEALERVLWPLAQAAVDLLRGGPLDRVKVCADCRWLFLDASRNHSRRWCSMNECGGRLKMRRYRARRATAGR